MFDLTIKSFKPYPNSKPDFINYGDLRLSKKSRNSFVITGSFSLFMNIGNEFMSKFEALRQDSNGEYRIFMAGSKSFCDFLKKETVIYPGLVKASNFPDAKTCPFPKVNKMRSNK